ncbi:MAG TPA: hypothetical protein VE990_01080 [Acidimicrobiales bacterium]|nr:hypothetical protein [Acidimicrobiales bacterium]
MSEILTLPRPARPSRLRRRAWPLATTVLTLVTGLAYSFWWVAVVRHARHPYWLTPGDLWLTARDAHYVTWGALPYIYGTGTALVALPGMAITLAPFALLVAKLGLVESFGPWVVPHSPAWLVYGPVTIIMACLLLFAGDAWVEDLGIAGWRRAGFSLAGAMAAWEVAARWGHPEDSLALGLALYCLLDVRHQRWRRAGWLLGLAACFQPLVVLVVPVVGAAAGWRRLWPLLVRASFLPACLLTAVLAVDAGDVIHSFVAQPNYPDLSQSTPWAWLSPDLGHHAIGAGPARMVALAVAFGLGWFAWRWRSDWYRLFWIGSCMLATRGVFEAVMVPYYVVPALFLALLVAWGRLPWWRAVAATGLAAGTIVMTSTRGPVLWWWLESVALLAATVAVCHPLGRRRRPAAAAVTEAPAEAAVVEESPGAGRQLVGAGV